MIYSLTEIEPRYQETDKMGVIYHGNYATWFEVARTDYIRKLGFSYADMEKQGIISPVTDLNIKYKKSIFYPEKVTIKTWVEKYSRLRSVYRYEIFNEQGELATTGYTELICMKADTFRPIRLDRYFADWHETYSKVEALNKEGINEEVTHGIDHL
ncbi:thioesterase family protein [Staphylococcus warneri]|uniref:1,4-dihydroxy-2-naphthoyl-CoA hydrolase MenI n=1 Tax=Staphylococcus warneri TaxID=1292 RepID=UPI0007371024|nr:thioesterase family protein [Staphylococcus warneri]AXZ23508.1 acyl-CoA thioesterase [Staphylococcus warneri]KTW07331.1 4-hydroxybenzoyl-CoA thioesterase [Staphylococcus warneri]OIS44940.1 4-hydroxybenzoyl-CoA thioesterase [Staphylococcus warneri]OIS47582.1 4-hydroxybenzoyl-CoA thioesterase [Staphylococcus warneri]PTI04983.1 acyl-CoA thioesterase [Staphylococcus warneri]